MQGWVEGLVKAILLVCLVTGPPLISSASGPPLISSASGPPLISTASGPPLICLATGPHLGQPQRAHRKAKRKKRWHHKEHVTGCFQSYKCTNVLSRHHTSVTYI
eukprot:1159889-Pelagomonas_calceolata.AAC.5